MNAQAETREFQAEARKLLDLLIHSVYSNKDVFLRELISNASDAMDKRRVESLSDTSIPAAENPRILIETDAEARTLTIHDTGIGMSRDEVIRYIGTLAKSGTKEFTEKLAGAKAPGERVDLIGQFGVGFYSAFMAADRVTLLTRRANETSATRWTSSGEGTYEIEEAERDEPGTSITLHLKPSDDEDALSDYTSEWKIREIVRKYSDFVVYPILLKVERPESDDEEEGKLEEGAKSKMITTEEQINSMKAIWMRPRSEVTDDEYGEFYRHISRDWNPPLRTITLRAEGNVEFHSLLFLPAKAPIDLFQLDGRFGISLYARRVFIMDDCREIVPPWMRFVRGVIDSEDLSLNISREILQQDRQIRMISKRVTKKIIESLDELTREDRKKFADFWGEFGAVIKEGLFQDHENRERLMDIALFESTADDKELVTLGEYTDRMKPGQEEIYYITGRSRQAVENSPHLEAFRAKGYEVLLLSDPVDELWTEGYGTAEYKGLKFKSVGRGEVGLGTEEERKAEDEKLKSGRETFGSFLGYLQGKLDEDIREVRLSSRLTSSPACLISDDHEMTPQMEQMMRAAGRDVPKIKRVLEVNAGHPLLEKLRTLYESDRENPRLADCAELIYGQALLAEGGTLPDPARFSRLLTDVMTSAV